MFHLVQINGFFSITISNNDFIVWHKLLLIKWSWESILTQTNAHQFNRQKPHLPHLPTPRRLNLFGDSKYDYQAAKTAGIDFIFLSGWTEVKDWQLFCQDNSIQHFDSLSSILHTSEKNNLKLSRP